MSTTYSGEVDAEVRQLFTSVMSDWRAKRAVPELPVALDRALWRTLVELGLSELSSADGADWWTSAELLRAAARHAAPVPLAEHDLLAGWLAQRAGFQPGDGIRTVALLDEAGRALRVPWASSVDRLVAAWGADGRAWVAEVDPTEMSIEAGYDLAGQPRDTVVVDAAVRSRAHEIDPTLLGGVRLRGALARAIQTTGALDEIVERTVAHVSERRQFGRPLARFQAVQHLLADAAAESTLARAATDAAIMAAARLDAEWGTSTELELRIAVARSVIAVSAGRVVRHAHQLHGAIGTTLEHPLQEFTKPVLAWRSEFGTPREWDERVLALASGGGSVWSSLV